jgi:hypothetical protein
LPPTLHIPQLTLALVLVALCTAEGGPARRRTKRTLGLATVALRSLASALGTSTLDTFVAIPVATYGSREWTQNSCGHSHASLLPGALYNWWFESADEGGSRLAETISAETEASYADLPVVWLQPGEAWPQ